MPTLTRRALQLAEILEQQACARSESESESVGGPLPAIDISGWVAKFAYVHELLALGYYVDRAYNDIGLTLWATWRTGYVI